MHILFLSHYFPPEVNAPASRTWSMYMALTVPPVPTGMKAGVRTTPRGMEISPRRALPSVAVRRKENCRLIGVRDRNVECQDL